MKKIAKIISAILVLVMALTLFAACGGDKGGSEPKGETKTRNGISVLVPDGFEFPEEDIYVDALVRKIDHTTNYVSISKYESVDAAVEAIDMSIGELEATDVKFEADGVTWEGKSYDLGGWPMCDVYAVFDGTVVMAHTSFFASDDATFRAIVGSIKLG